MPSPLVHSLLPCALAASSSLPSKLPRAEKIRFFVLCLLLGNCPDFDLIPTLFDSNLWTVVHRWYGHNFMSFALLVIFGIWALRRFVPTLTPRERGLASLLLVASHLILDGMVAPAIPRTGVPFFWPFNSDCLHFPVLLFPQMTHAPGMHKLLGVAASTNNWKYVFGAELLMSLTLWALLTLSARLINQFVTWAKSLVSKLRTKGALNLSLRSSPQCIPAHPSPRRQGGSPSRTYKDSELES